MTHSNNCPGRQDPSVCFNCQYEDCIASEKGMSSILYGEIIKSEPIKKTNRPCGVVQMDLNMNVIATYKSLHHAERETGFSRPSMRYAANKPNGKYNGFMWAWAQQP